VTATAGPIRWYTDSIGGTFTASITPVSSVVGTVSYWVSEYDGTTESSRVKVNVIVNDLPANPSVASPIDVCQGETAAALLAFGTGLKYYDATTYLGTTAPVPVTTTAGVQTFYVTQTDATTTCESDKEPITINVNASPAAPTVTSPVNLCEGIAASALSATGTSLLWYTVSSGGTGSATAPTPSTTTAGTTIYYVSQTNLSTGCEGSRASISAVVNPIPSAPGVSSISYCKNASASPLTAYRDCFEMVYCRNRWYRIEYRTNPINNNSRFYKLLCEPNSVYLRKSKSIDHRNG
jgi:large repetitive protein